MEVRIRLQKAGKSASKRYNYRVVAISKTDTRDGRHLDLLGYYDPAKKPAIVSINKQKLNKWLKQGAQMSDTVKALVKNLKDN
ncbi:MAG: 30S ribosomal protein S16 [Candidatus Omnitrophica bacterium]|nr:30S ribosomal protein S16 [Candidatus Omnitrophota bacterium]